MHADDVQHGFAVLVVFTEGAAHHGQLGAGFIGVAGHDRGHDGGKGAPFIAVIGESEAHQDGAEVGVAEPERPVKVRIGGNLLGGVAGAAHENFLGDDKDADRVAETLDIQVAVGIHELHHVERRQIAGAVVEEHVLGAGIAGIDPAAVDAGVPAVDRGVVLHAGIPAQVGAFGNHLHQVGGGVGLDHIPGGHGPCLPVAVVLNGLHEFIRNPDGEVGVLEHDRRIGFAAKGTVVALVNQCPGFLLLVGFAGNEVDDVRMRNLQALHFGGATGFSARLDDRGNLIEDAHEAEGAGRRSAAGESFAAAA